MKLYIAEKPKLAGHIANALGVVQKAKGFIECDGGVIVTWCSGHLLELAQPEDYNESLREWSLDALPIIPSSFKRVVTADRKKQTQFNIIKGLINKASFIVNAGDPDPEGAYLVDEVIEHCNYKGAVGRVLVGDLTLESAKKGLNKEHKSNVTTNDSNSARARSECDWLYGINLTRLFTLLAGNDNVLSLGRVQTSLLSLIVMREREIENFTPTDFYSITASVGGGDFGIKFIDTETEGFDSDKRLVNKDLAISIIETAGDKGVVKSRTSKEIKSHPPLPFDLASLLQASYKSFGINSSDAKKIAESLYLEHELITYPRSDNRYLYDESYNDGLNRIEFIDEFCGTNWTKNVIPDYKSPAFNDANCGAHTAIIPTLKNPKECNLSEDERNVYQLIALRFVAQFLGQSISDKTEITLEIENCEHPFFASGVVKKVLGFESLVGSKKDKVLPNINEGDIVAIDNIELVEKVTTPPKYFNEDTILSAMVNIASFVSDKKIKALLKESQGIGTPATQTETIATLAKRKYIDRGKNIRATKLGFEFYDSLLPDLKNIGMTGLWEGMLKDIREGLCGDNEIKSSVLNVVKNSIDKQSEISIKVTKEIPEFNCPECKRGLARRKGPKGYFWGCLGFKDGCKFSCEDKRGSPDLNPEVFNCPQCQNKLVRRKGTNGYFWGCLGFKDGCKSSFNDKRGKPDLAPKQPPKASGKVTHDKCGGVIVRRYSKAKDFYFWVHESENSKCDKFVKDLNGKPD